MIMLRASPIMEALEEIITLPHFAKGVETSNSLDNACMQTQLPIREGGMGLCTAVDRAGPAFIAAVLSTRIHHTLAIEEFMHALRPFCAGAYDSLESSLAGVSVQQCRQITKFIPNDAISLTTLSQNALRQSSQNKVKKLLHVQGAVVNEIYRRKRIYLRGTAVVSREAAKALHDLVKADFSRLLLVTSRSQFSRIFTCSLYRFENRIDVEYFIRVVRWYFGRSQPVPEHAALGRDVMSAYMILKLTLPFVRVTMTRPWSSITVDYTRLHAHRPSGHV